MRNVSRAPKGRSVNQRALQELIEQITIDADDEGEQLWAFHLAIEREIVLPTDAFVIGEPVSVRKFNYDGNLLRGLTAKCRRPDGRQHVVAAADVVFAEGTAGARYIGAYRKWMGLSPLPSSTPGTRKAQRENAISTIPGEQLVDLAVLSAKQQTGLCRFLGNSRIVTLRSRKLWVPGEIVRLKRCKEWECGSPNLSAEIGSSRMDAGALGLVPLRLREHGIWDPLKEHWQDQGEPLAQWAKPIISRGPRPAFEMEQVLPGYNFADPDSDPIGVSNDLKDSGDRRGAHKILMELCAADLRCLDAHAHLGNLAFDLTPRDAIRHYEAGFRIGELSLSESFEGVLPWGRIDNRPFLRCMHGFGLCLWRLGRFEEAFQVFHRMLRLNPSDNQGVRFLIDDIAGEQAWEDRRDQ
ncbi:MAG TPA: tetratricopeptide repeat protein [Bryobacteraceae bacterium]|nr:tetratricopeptide repeat protein [Bryobacteraceae bacterium]